MPAAEIQWSEFRDVGTLGQNCTVKQMLGRVDIRIQRAFQKILNAVSARANRHEIVYVHWWYAPFIYIEVNDKRWKHYPCGHRFLVSFDITNGKLDSSRSANSYSFARKGWRRFAEKLTGHKVRHYSDCGDRENRNHC